MIAGPDLNDDFSGWLRYPECVADLRVTPIDD
jgi:hypothetical protein